MQPRAGVLALQGDFAAHARMLSECGADAVEIRTSDDLESVDALVIPGGESTTIGLLLDRFDLAEPIRARGAAGMPILGTCAGLIVCSKRVLDPAIVSGKKQTLLGLVDIEVRRNAYGRQADSFETELDVKGLDTPLHAVFIRAPRIERVGSNVDVLAEYDGNPVAVRHGKIVLVAFHPEIAGDGRLHRLFVEGI